MLNNKNVPSQSAINMVNNLPNFPNVCENKSDAVKLQTKVVLEFGEDYTITMPIRRNPKIRVTNMKEKRTEVNIIASIKQHNELTKDTVMRLVHMFEGHTMKHMKHMAP